MSSFLKFAGKENKDDGLKHLEGLSFQDSWKQTSVELAAAGALVAGAALYGATGHFDDVVRHGKKAMGRAGQGLNKYINRIVGPTGQFSKNTIIKTVKGIANKKTSTADELLEINKRINSLDRDKIERNVRRRVGDRHNFLILQHHRDVQNGRKSADSPFLPKIDVKLIEQQEIDNEKARVLGLPLRRGKFNQNEENKGKGLLGSSFKEYGQKAVGTIAAGSLFATGITALHGIDRQLRGDTNEHRQRRDQSFNFAGSNLRNQDVQRKREQRNYQQSPFRSQLSKKPAKDPASSMLPTQIEKKADARAIYEGMHNLVKKPFESAAGGLGFTGVSLGGALMYKNHLDSLKTQNENRNPNNTRITIEMGNPHVAPEEDIRNNPLVSSGMRLMGAPAQHGMPRQAENIQSDFTKEATFSEFVKNLAGRSAEVRNLETRINGHIDSYNEPIIQNLRSTLPAGATEQQVNDFYRQHFGASYKDGFAPHFQNQYLLSQRGLLRRQDEAKLDQIKGDVAAARLKFGAGVLGAGGLAGAGYMTTKKEEGTINR